MIHIYYRHYNVGGSISRQDDVHQARTDGSERPPWFDYENCFKNLLQTIKNKNVKLNLIMDGNFEENWISKYKDKYTLYNIKAGNDLNSFLQTIEIIKNDFNVKDTDIIYLLEDDYVHMDGWVDKVEELFSSYKDITYVTLFDHLDKYYYDMYKNLLSKIIITHTHHWRTVPNTCASFLITKKTFYEDYEILSQWKGDFNSFTWLNKHKNRFVISPIPGLSSHCVKFCESPTINWQKYAE